MGRIAINGKLAQFSCKLNVKPALWDTKANRAKGKSLEAQKINQKLDNIRSQITKHYQHISDRDAFVSAQKVKNAYLGFGDEHQSFFAVYDEFLEEYSKRVGRDRSIKTYQRIALTRKRITWFMKAKLKLSDISISEVDAKFAQDFYYYLCDDRGFISGTSAKEVKTLKQIMFYAKRKGYIQTENLRELKVKSEFRERGFLTEDELKLMMNAKLKTARQRQIRDTFIFCAFTGLAYSDVKNLSFNEIQKSFDGELWLIGNRKKTGSKYSVKLLPVAKQLIEEYSKVSKSEFIFPVPSTNLSDEPNFEKYCRTMWNN